MQEFKITRKSIYNSWEDWSIRDFLNYSDDPRGKGDQERCWKDGEDSVEFNSYNFKSWSRKKP
jgi:hypothetical protein